MITFRPVRGGFSEAMRDSRDFYSIDSLLHFLMESKYYDFLGTHKSIDSFVLFKNGRFDSRLSAFVFDVFIYNHELKRYCIIGYIW